MAPVYYTSSNSIRSYRANSLNKYLQSCVELCSSYSNNSNNNLTTKAAFQQMSEQLHASSSDISFSLSFFILVQGNAPLFWAAVSEVKGRKVCLSSLAVDHLHTINVLLCIIYYFEAGVYRAIIGAIRHFKVLSRWIITFPRCC